MSLQEASQAQALRVVRDRVVTHLFKIVCRHLGERQRYYGNVHGGREVLDNALNTVTAALHVNLDRAALDALLISNLAGDTDSRREVYSIVHGWLMDNSASVMQFYSVKGMSPGRYPARVAEELRRAIQENLRGFVLPDDLPDDVTTLKSMVNDLKARNSQLERTLWELRNESSD
tara:strand:+ start:1113 stop:1637 length:525 start_codon:yes stop_codon:yes gene_type:complete